MALFLPGYAHLEGPKEATQTESKVYTHAMRNSNKEGPSAFTSSQTIGLLASVAGGEWKRNLSDRSSKALGECCVLNAVSSPNAHVWKAWSSCGGGPNHQR